MAILDKIKSKTRVNVNEIINILKKEFDLKEDDLEKLHYSLYSTLQLILSTTNRTYIIEDMFTLWVDMTKDYWYLNKYDKSQENLSTNTEEQTTDEEMKVKRIERGDTNIEFRESNNETTINGITYKTGTIEFDEDLLLNKYRKRLYKFRLLSKKRGW